MELVNKVVTWRESVVCLLDGLNMIHVQSRVANAKLDNTSLITRDDGVAGSTLYGCRVNSCSAQLSHCCCAAGAFLKKLEI